MVSAGGFCIDTTEVSKHDYNAFLTAVGGTGGAVARTPACAWKTGNSAGCASEDPDPIACVDWCDAVAFCAWSGKRLCGAVGNGGSLDFNQAGNRVSSEWSAACSPTGNTYPYGTTVQPTTCNTEAPDGSASPGVVPVGSLAACVGGLPGLYDMSGNVEEWIDSCEGDGGSPKDICHEGGDCFNYASTGIGRCDGNDTDERDFTGTDVGIRCCATP